MDYVQFVISKIVSIVIYYFFCKRFGAYQKNRVVSYYYCVVGLDLW